MMNSPVNRLLRFRNVVRCALSETEMAMETETEDHVRIIQSHYNQLLNSLTSVGDIVAEIFQTGNLSNLELEYLQSYESTPIRASAELLNIIMRKPSTVYEQFLLALKKARQQDAYLLLTTTKRDTNPAKQLVYSDHCRLIRQNYDWLTSNLSCDCGLIARLLESEVLAIREYEQIRSKTDLFKKNEVLLSIIMRKSAEEFIKFQKALIETGQNGVCEKLRRLPIEDDSDQHRHLIQQNFSWLAEAIDSSADLISILYQTKVITFRERETIYAEKDSIKMNESILSIIAQKSETNFEQFKDALRETKQDHVVQKITEKTRESTVKILKTHKARMATDINVHQKQPLRPSVPPKPRKLQDFEQCRQNAAAATTQLQQHTTSSKFYLERNLLKLENTMKLEISLKVTAMRQRKTEQSRDVFNECLKTVLKDSHDIRREMKRVLDAGRKTTIKEENTDETESEKLKQLNCELQSAMKKLVEEMGRRQECEKQYKLTNEMYDHMRQRFQEQIKLSEMKTKADKFQIDELNSFLEKEKRIRKIVEKDLQEESNSVRRLNQEIQEYKNELEQQRNNAISFAESIDVKNLEEELLKTKFELDSTKDAKRQLEYASEKHKNQLKEADNRSHLVKESLHSLIESLGSLSHFVDENLCIGTDRLNNAIQRITDFGKKLKLLEEKFASLEKEEIATEPPLSDPDTLSVQYYQEEMAEEEAKLNYVETALINTKREILQKYSLEEDESVTNAVSRQNEQQAHHIAELVKSLQELLAENVILKKKSEQLEIQLKDLEIHLYPQDNFYYSEKPARLHRIKAEPGICATTPINGLAILENKLFVMHCNSSVIEVYDSNSNQFLRKLQIPKIRKAFDVTAGKVDKCLFIIGVQNETTEALEESPSYIKEDNPSPGSTKTKQLAGFGKKIAYRMKMDLNIGSDEKLDPGSEIVKVDSSGELLSPWPRPSGGEYGQLSTKDSNLVVCLYYEQVINEFSRDGNLLLTVKLNGLKHPLHAIKVTNLHFAVSVGDKIDDLQKICVVDLDGNVRKECTELKQLRLSSSPKFNSPVYLVEDGERSLLVADRDHNQILLVNSALKYQRQLIQFKDEEYPRRLCFDEAQNSLFVATDLKSTGFLSKGLKQGIVLVYKMR